MPLRLLTQLSKSFIDLIYPPLCLHCFNGLEKEQPLFCRSCLELLVPIDPEERCPYCFSMDFEKMRESCCQSCSESPPIIDRTAAVFDYEGPAATLVKRLKYGGQSYLAKGAGAYMAAQFIRLEWPLPDAIIPMPMASLRRAERGYNQTLLLARSLGAILDRPVLDVLKRRGGDFSQAGLSLKQRLELKSDRFAIKKGVKFEDQCLLLVDDVMTSGSSLRCCAETLFELYPRKIYAMTVCRAI